MNAIEGGCACGAVRYRSDSAPVRSSGHPDLLFLHAATLDDPAQFKADRVVWSASRPPWDHIDPDLPCD